jgi:DNA sulfur modification protein DndD
VILHALTLDGVGPYADRQTLEFAHDERRPVTLVGGLNGTGKTTLIRSLFQILYGARALSELGRHRSYGAFLADSVNNERQEASLELALTVPGLANDARITVRRRWKANARSSSEQLDVFVGNAYDGELSESWDETIEQIAPLGVARLFFFDGEKIEALADLESAADSLRTAVGSLLGLDLVAQLQTDLVAVQRRVLRESPGAFSAELEKKQTTLDAALELAAGTGERVAALEAELATLEEEYERVRGAVRAVGGDLVAERAELEARAGEFADEEELAWVQLRELAGDALAPLALVPDLLGEVLATAEQSRESKVARDLDIVIAKRDSWLLDELEKLGGEGFESLESILADERKARRETEAAPAFHPNSSPEEIHAVRDERLTAWRFEVMQALDGLGEAVRHSDELDRRISKIPHDESVTMIIEQAQQTAARLEELHERVEGERKLLAANEAAAEAARGRRDAELARLADAEDSHERHQRVTRHAERARDTLGLLRTRIAQRHVGRISDFTMQCLELLLRKDRLIEGVAIDPETFAVSLFGDHGKIRPGSLSAGERQLTALSLLWALARAAGLPLPVVIDTPLGRLDAGHREHVVQRYLPAASHQVLVLSTDTEIDAELHAHLRPSIGAQRRLDNDAEGRTKIVDGYFELISA